MNQYLQAAIKLQKYITAHYWQNHSLIGPDPSLRLNDPIKIYLRNSSWKNEPRFFANLSLLGVC